jgi:hypothetical protein
MADFHKRVRKNERFKFIKWFTFLKTVNHFSKIKKNLLIKLKIIFVDHYFRLHQSQKKKYFLKNILHTNKQTKPYFSRAGGFCIMGAQVNFRLFWPFHLSWPLVEIRILGFHVNSSKYTVQIGRNSPTQNRNLSLKRFNFNIIPTT